MPFWNLSNRFANRKVRVIAYALTTATFAIFAVLLASASLERSVAGTNERLQGLVSMSETAVEVYFQMFEKALSALAQEIATLPPGQDPYSTLTRFKTRYPELEIVTLTSADGHVLHSTLGPSNGSVPPIYVGKEPGFLDAKARLINGATMDVGRVLRGPVTKRLFTPLRLGVRSPAGKLIYILTAGLSVTRPHEFWSKAPVPNNAAFGLLREDHFLIARQPTLPVGLESQFFYPDDWHSRHSFNR